MSASQQSLRNSMRIRSPLADSLLTRLGASRDATSSHLLDGRLAVMAVVLLCSLLSAMAAFAQERENDEGEWNPRDRQEWFYKQRAFPLVQIPTGARLRALEEMVKMRQAERDAATLSGDSAGLAVGSSAWTLIGPEPASIPFNGMVSGRVSAVAVDPTDATGNTVYIGGAQGGVWKTTDGGTTWTPLTDNQFSLAIGSLAIDPNNHLNVYAGTGEENFSGDSYYGGGLLKSGDAGATWTPIGTLYFGGAFGKFSPEFGGSFIGAIAIQPGAGASTPVLLVASQFGGGPQHYYYSGIWRSTDGGTTWTHVLPTTFDSNAFGVSVFFVNNTTAYAAIGSPGGDANNGVYLSTDAGQTWTPASGSGSTAIISGTSAGRITLVTAPSSPSTLYASIESPSTGGLAGMFTSTDGGTTWHAISTPLGTGGGGSTLDFCGAQCWYDMALGVSPANPNLIYAGGTDDSLSHPLGAIYFSNDGGNSWSPANSQLLIHTDVHTMTFNTGGGKLYVGSDGGMWSTTNVGTTSPTWTDLNTTLALTQFYPNFSLSGSTPNSGLIGTQDNGTLLFSGGLTWTYTTCGDGFSTAVNPVNNNIMWAVCNGRVVLKSVDGGTTWNLATNGIAINAPGPLALAMDYQKPDTLYVGTSSVWQTTDGAATPWTSISGPLSGSSSSGHITTLAVSPISSSTLFVGATDSAANTMVWFTTNTGATWTQIPSGLPSRWITMVQGDPQTSAIFYATFSGFSGFATGDTFGHVFSCSTASASCADISSNLPNIPVNDIVVDPAGSNTLYIGTDLGVFRSTNGGGSWSAFSNGLPNVAVLGLRMHAPSRTLLAATHGRSAWEITAPVGGTAATTTALTLAPQAVLQGSAGPVVMTATVTPASGSGTPTGMVGFFNGALQINSVSLTNGTASINYSPSSLAGGTYSITASYSGDATFASSTSPAQQLTIQVLSVSLSTNNLPFAGQLITTASTAQTITATNSGTAPLTISSIAISGTNSGDFSQTNTCPAANSTLAAGAKCTINVMFTPAATGARAATLSITDNASGSPHAVALSGTGTDFALAAASGNNCPQGGNCTTSATINAGQTATWDLQVTPVDGFNGVVALSCTGAPASTACAVSPSSVPPNNSMNYAFSVTVSNTANAVLIPIPGTLPARPLLRKVFGCAIAALMLALLAAKVRSSSSPLKWALAPAGALLFLCVIYAAGCGGGPTGPPPPPPPTNAVLTITGTSTGVNRTVSLSLTVNH